MARHKNPQLSLENLLDLAAEYKSFSQIVVGLVSLAAGMIALVLHLNSYPIGGVGLLFLLLSPIFVALVLQLGYELGIHRRVRALSRSASA